MEDEGNPIDPWYYWLGGILILLIAISGYFSGEGILGIADPTPRDSIEDLENRNSNFFTISNLLGQGELKLGERVSVMNKEIQVRRDPGGQILGLQKRLSDGRLMEGPVNAFQTLWWRVNFEEAPSGWVEYDSLTAKSGLLKTIFFPQTFYKAYKPIGWILSIILLIIVLILRMKVNRENKIAEKKARVQDEQVERENMETASDFRDELGLPVEEYKNDRWEHIQELMKSNTSSDWRQAIIEADIILDEMLRRMSYKGTSIGDMLKTVDPADFATLQKAWEAHKFRNEIAHTGSEFKLSKDEADRVINLFKSVFDEFYYI
jgi:hypothetical protein